MTTKLLVPATISDRIRKLRAGDNMFLSWGDGISARAIASRIARETKRKYVSKREGDGIRFWRMK